MSWHPQEDILQTILKLLEESLFPDTATQSVVTQKLEEIRKYPDFNKYLMFVLMKLPFVGDSTRSLSGLILKNIIKDQFEKIPPAFIEFLKLECLNRVGDPSPLIQATIGSLLTTIASKGELNWVDLAFRLCHLLDSEDYNVCKGSFSALQNICEDSTEILNSNALNMAINILIPKFLNFFKHSSAKIRSHAIACINQFIINRTQVLMLHINGFLENLLHVAFDEDPEVTKYVCQAFLMLLEVGMFRQTPNAHHIIMSETQGENNSRFTSQAIALPQSQMPAEDIETDIQPTGKGQADQYLVEKLTALGYEKNSAVRSLKFCSNIFDTAVQYLNYGILPFVKEPIEFYVPSIALYWDIENVRLSKEMIVQFAQNLRTQFLQTHSEREFYAVFKLEKNEFKNSIVTIGTANISILHVQSTEKNAADYAIKERMGSYVREAPGFRKSVLLISNDGGFAKELGEFRKVGVNTIVIYSQPKPSLNLLKQADEKYHVSKFLEPYIIASKKRKRTVSIQTDLTNQMVNLHYYSSKLGELSFIEIPFCVTHSTYQHWADRYSSSPVPVVHVSLKALSTAVNKLLASHEESLPLNSFCDCYNAEINSLPVIGCIKSLSSPDQELSDYQGVGDTALCKNQNGVPLEHLITCVAGVEICESELGIKKVQRVKNKIADSQSIKNYSPVLERNLTVFEIDVVVLLKSRCLCLIDYKDFLPAYFRYFKRPCRVADYGFTKLNDLIDSIPHILQIIGEDQNQQLTLTHRTQVAEFSADMLSILKSQGRKRITISEIPKAYEKEFKKPFYIINYGVCYIEDMLDEVSKSSITVCKVNTEVAICIPERAEEIGPIQQFSAEVIELMEHTPICSMSFKDFVPAYYKYFRKQCRVTDFGFSKLIQLLEAIPDVLEIKGSGEERILSLAQKEQHKIITDRLVSILKSQPNEVFNIHLISLVYAKMFGHDLIPQDFGFDNLLELLEGMDCLEVCKTETDIVITTVKKGTES